MKKDKKKINIDVLLATSANITLLQAVFDATPNYFERSTGAPASTDAAKYMFAATPPDRLSVEKVVFGIWLGADLIGVCDVVLNYPQNGTSYIGLFLISEKYHRQKLGGTAYALIERRLEKEYATEIVRLGVSEGNAAVCGFWEKNDFLYQHDSSYTSRNGLKRRASVFQKQLKP